MEKPITLTVLSTDTRAEIRDTITAGDSDAYPLSITFSDLTAITGTVRFRFVRGDDYWDRDATVAGNVASLMLEPAFYAATGTELWVSFEDSNLYTPLHVYFRDIRVPGGNVEVETSQPYPSWADDMREFDVAIGTVETLEPGADATASITGDVPDKVLNLGIPKGDTGDVTPEAQAAASTATAQAALAQGYAAQLAAGVASPAGTYSNLSALIADNPDHGKIYITLDDGNWCYHNGSAFVAGGVYQATALETDKTLTVSDTAADAKVTGDKVGELKSALDDKVDKYIGVGTPESLPVETNDKKNVELSESGKVYNSNGNLYDICGLVDGTYQTAYGITLTVTNKSHIAVSGTATAAHYIKITDNVQAGLTRSGCGADTISFDYPVGDNWYLCFKKNIASSILVYVVADDGTVATGGNSLQNDRAFKLENYSHWAGIVLYFSNGYEVPSGVEINVSLQIGNNNPYVIPDTDVIDTFTSGVVDSNGLIASNKTGTATSLKEFDPDQVLDDIDNLYNLDSYVGKVYGTGSNIYIVTGKTQYNVAHIENASINADLWRVYAGSVRVGDNWEYLWNGQDADGVVSIKGEDDFIGGFHGDEILTNFALFIDGVEQDSTTFSEKPFNEVVIYQESNVYHCNTSLTPSVVAFKRNKVITFNAQGFTVKNNWEAQETLELTTAYFGMLSVQKLQSDGTRTMDNGYTTNVDYKFHDNSTGFNNNEGLTMVTFNTAGGDITIEAKAMTQGHYKGNVSHYSSSPDRLKVYMGPIIASSATAVTVNNGDVLRGEARIFVK